MNKKFYEDLNSRYAWCVADEDNKIVALNVSEDSAMNKVHWYELYASVLGKKYQAFPLSLALSHGFKFSDKLLDQIVTKFAEAKDPDKVFRAETWKGLLDQLSVEGYSFDGHYYDEPYKWIKVSDSEGNTYEIEITKYFRGGYEVLPENINMTPVEGVKTGENTYGLFSFADKKEYEDFLKYGGFTDLESCRIARDFEADSDEEAKMIADMNIDNFGIYSLCKKYADDDYEPLYQKTEGVWYDLNEDTFQEKDVYQKLDDILFYVVKNNIDKKYLGKNEDDEIFWTVELEDAEAFDERVYAEEAIEDLVDSNIPDQYKGSLDDATAEKCLDWQEEEIKNYSIVGIKADSFHESKLKENAVSSELPPSVDKFLQDLAQGYIEGLTYTHIINHNYTPEEIKKIKFYAKECRQLANEADEEEIDSYIKEVVAPSFCKIFGVKDKCELKEAQLHHYVFLFSDGNGAASRGTDVDTYYNVSADAENLNDATAEAWAKFNDYESFEEWAEDGGYEPEKAADIRADVLNYIDGLDITGGDPWIEGIMEDDKIVRRPDARTMMEYGYEFDNSDDADFWGLDPYSYDEEDDWDDEDEEEDFDESKMKESECKYTPRKYSQYWYGVLDTEKDLMVWKDAKHLLLFHSKDEAQKACDELCKDDKVVVCSDGCLQLKEAKIKESDMKSFMRHMCEKVKKTSHLKEKLKNSLDFQDIKDAMKNDEELAKFMNTPLKDLPENYKYIIGRDSWDDMKDVTPVEYSEFFYKMYPYFGKLLSEKDDELLGWISYNVYGPTIFDIKMFSFKPEYQNITFMRDLKEFFETIVNKYPIINWTADKDNPFIKHYYKAIEEYNGEAIENEDGFTVSFMIDKFKNRKDESKIEESEEEPTRDELKAKIKKYMTPEFNKEEWEPEDIELWKSIDWKERNYEEYAQEDPTLYSDVYFYSKEGTKIKKDVPFCKVIRANEIFPPYYKCMEEFPGYVGGMYDGRKYGKYMLMDRYETQEVYDFLGESKVKESYTDSLKKKHKYLEKLQKTDFEELLKDAQKDEEFKDFFETKILDLPKSVKYSIGSKLYNEFKDKTPKDYAEYFFKNYDQFIVLTSKEDKKNLGWLAFTVGVTDGSINNVKFGSFYPADTSKNYILLKEITNFLKDCIDNEVEVNFVADKENPFTKHYYKWLEEIGGSVESWKDNTLLFHYSKRDRDDRTDIIESLINKSQEMKESFKLEVFDKNGKVIDYQAGFRTPSEARGFVDYNDDKYPAGYTFKITEAAEKNHYCSKFQESEETENALEDLFDKYVPMEGIADTVGGEIVRAINRIVYRYYNDGDMIAYDYGVDTCNSSYAFLARYVGDIYDKYKPYNYMDDITYKKFLDELEDTVYNYLLEHEDLFTKNNVHDSRRDYKYEDYTPEEDEEDEYYESKMRVEESKSFKDWSKEKQDEYLRYLIEAGNKYDKLHELKESYQDDLEGIREFVDEYCDEYDYDFSDKEKDNLTKCIYGYICEMCDENFDINNPDNLDDIIRKYLENPEDFREN